MNNLIITGLVVAIVIMLGLSLRVELGGFGYDSPSFSSATNAVVSCSGATSTLALAASVSRASFIATASTSDITLCRTTSGCVDGTGIIVVPDTYFEQNDGYTGAYSCISRGAATTTLHISHSQ